MVAQFDERIAAPRAPNRRSRTRSLLLLLLFLALPLASLAEDESPTAPSELGEMPVLTVGPLDYHPGRGLRVDSTGLTIGGFTNVKAETTQRGGYEVSLDLLNFFLIYDYSPRFHAVAELQLKDIFVSNPGDTGGQDFAFDIRRLFGDFAVSDELHVRAGTFLTPVGYWNLILAPPLTWTSENPLIVEKTFFQQTTTGVMLYGSTDLARGQLGYSLFSQFLKPIEDDPDVIPPNYTAGARLTYDVGPAWTGGATYQAAQVHGGWSQLGAVHLLWQPRYGELLSECYFQNGDNLPDALSPHHTSQWGAYIQGVFNVYGPFFLVGRYEHFDPPDSQQTVDVFTTGAVWKPYPFMAVKVEYRFANHATFEDENLQGFFSSFTTFF